MRIHRPGTRLSYALIVFLLVTQGDAQPTISGPLSGSLGPGDFIVTGDCTVPAGETLSIQPGTRLLFSGHYTLFVSGEIQARGNATDSVYFMRQYPDSTCLFGGIRINTGASEDNLFVYCRVDYASNLEFPYYFGGGLFCEGAGLTIAHSTFSNCTAWFGAGLYITYSDAYLTDCLITGNHGIAEGTALFASFSTIKIENSVVDQNLGDHVGGIYLYLNDQAEIGYCTVTSNIAQTTAG